jgi:ABC-type polysaccharide/polyol phosphate transport system ATPase subunit
VSSTSNSVVVRARDLAKVYRLYATPRHRLLDVLGLLPRRSAGVREHAALCDVTFDVRRGEKVAIIGRNGAGKSTLLRLVTHATAPTSGTLDVRGESQALLQIGTGFHPDLTGRENALAYLSHLGVTGADAPARMAEVTAFAELEEYIDQPLKTYSSGMAMRLMFAAATVIAPSLLVIDEVLGVGDAYFAKKSFDRIAELCSCDGTTLLLVTHDIYNAARLCDRMLWMDRGRIVLDERPDVVITAYEDSIRRQEERRLRLKALGSAGAAGKAAGRISVEIHAVGNRPLPAPLFLSRLALSLDDVVIDAAPVVERVDIIGSTGELLHEGAAWGDPASVDGRVARPFLNFGSVFHKVAATFAAHGLVDAPDVAVLFDAWTEKICAVDVVLSDGDRERPFGRFDIPARRWTSVEARPTAAVSGHRARGARTTFVGSGAVVLTGIRACDAAGRTSFIYEHGAPLALRVAYRVNDRSVTAPQMIVVFHRNGVEDACRIFRPRIDLEAAAGEVVVLVPRLALGAGQYTVSVAVAEAGYYDRAQTLFFSINPGMYDCWSRALELRVVSAAVVATGTIAVLEAEWSVSSVHAAAQ